MTTAQTLTAAEQAQARGNIAAAPSGYGFGGEAIPTIAAASANEPYDTFCARVDGVLNTMTDGSVKLVRAYPPQLRGYGHDVCVLYKAGANYVGLRTLSGYNNQFYGFCMMKYKTYDSDPAGAWRPLEWVTPPLATGVEYRTTERYHGKPVYAKVVDCGQIADGKTVAHGISDMSDLLSVQGRRGGLALPQIYNHSLTDAWTAYVAGADRTKIIFACGTSAAGGNIYVTLKYTKSTD